ncbi:hypothetical protein STRMOE7_21120 [Streptomyces sp. MOE7]|nr:hypothetical protein STRMOE7_21120 [Streptomyces sp. MOE7]
MTGLAAVPGNVGGGAAVGYGGWRTLFGCAVPPALAALVVRVAFAVRRLRRDNTVAGTRSTAPRKK